MMPTTPQEISLVWGCTDIAEMIGRSERQTFYLLESGSIPARKVGNRWVADRNKLVNHFLTGENA